MGPRVRGDDDGGCGTPRQSPAINSAKTPRVPPTRVAGATVSLSVSDHSAAKTAFVFAGGGSFGAIQVGMMHSLAAHGISPDMVVASTVAPLNRPYYPLDPPPYA